MRQWRCSWLDANGKVEEGLMGGLVGKEDGDAVVDIKAWQDGKGELLGIGS